MAGSKTMLNCQITLQKDCIGLLSLSQILEPWFSTSSASIGF